MAELFKQMIGVNYSYTEKPEEVPEKVREGANSYGAWPDNDEEFVAACWIDQMGARYNAYVVITKSMILSVKPGKQSSTAEWVNVSSIGRTAAVRDVELMLPGGKLDLFHTMNLPNMKLLDKIEQKCREAQKSRPSTVQSPNVPSEDIPTQIKKLKGLLDEGILSQEEFDKKKAELLAKM